jgi:uncharacterized protein
MKRVRNGQGRPLFIGGLLACLVLGACTAEDGETLALFQRADKSEQAEKTQEAEPSPLQPPGRRNAGHTNRLARETSPYLLSHAHNPVDWYPWGPEAFERAKREDKPIFLSIGYSSCHWCHVMERKVFSVEKIAKVMNDHFVCIKVDREERPDVDDIYMTALQVYFQASGISQGGGWPLSIFLTPEGRPIAGGTYFPPEDQDGRIGFPTFMERVRDIWINHRETVDSNADILAREVRRLMKPQLVLTPVPIERRLVAEVAQALKDTYDPVHGGIDYNTKSPDAAKFPVPAKLALLQYEARRHGDAEAAKILYHTLDQLAAGGIRDHLGGGFHRYSTDRQWHVPHFEKMLYDNAQLADVYVEAFRQTGKRLYREVAIQTLDFVLRKMTDPAGGFYSALDAETEAVEGKYYAWSRDEVARILGTNNARLFFRVYGLDRPQEFPHGYVLHLPQSLDEAAAELNLPVAELQRQLEPLRQELLRARQQREPPMLDDKILTSWNGLTISAFAHAGEVFGRRDYVAAAEKAAVFMAANMRDDQKRLLRTYRSRQAKLNAYLDDYAFLVAGMLALHQATADEKWLNAARRLTDQQIELFWDEQGKGFFFTSHHHEELLARTKNAYDAVLPSGNSVSIRNLLRLASLSGQEKYRDYARETLELFAHSLQQTPRGTANMALAMGEFLDNPDFKAGSDGAADRGPAPRNGAPAFDFPDLRSAAGHQQSAAAPTPIDRAQPEGVNTGFERGLAAGGDSILPASGQSPSAPEELPPPPNKPEKDKDELIAARAYLSVDRLPAGDQCRIVMVLDVKDGWHINTNPARPDFLVPTKLTMKSKHGTKLAKLQYPVGRKLDVPGFDEPLHVYDKQVAIHGLVEVPAEAGGQMEELELIVQYQACNDAKCLSPKTVKLQGRLAVASQGEPVKPINEAIFNPPPKR